MLKVSVVLAPYRLGGILLIILRHFEDQRLTLEDKQELKHDD
jgi:hypothetical protein